MHSHYRSCRQRTGIRRASDRRDQGSALRRSVSVPRRIRRLWLAGVPLLALTLFTPNVVHAQAGLFLYVPNSFDDNISPIHHGRDRHADCASHDRQRRDLSVLRRCPGRPVAGLCDGASQQLRRGRRHSDPKRHSDHRNANQSVRRDRQSRWTARLCGQPQLQHDLGVLGRRHYRAAFRVGDHRLARSESARHQPQPERRQPPRRESIQ